MMTYIYLKSVFFKIRWTITYKIAYYDEGELGDKRTRTPNLSHGISSISLKSDFFKCVFAYMASWLVPSPEHLRENPQRQGKGSAMLGSCKKYNL